MALPAVTGLITAIVGWITGHGWQVSRQILVVGLLFAGLKTLFIGLVTLVLPVVLYTTGSDLMIDAMNWGVSKIAETGLSPTVISLSGVAGWLAVQCKVPECVSIVLSGAYIRLVLQLLRVI